MKDLEVLRDLTNNLPLFETMANAAHCPTVEYDVEGGVCIGFGLFDIPEVAVQRAVMSSGTIFPEHTHEAHECLIVYKGHVVFEMNGDSIDLKVADSIHIPPRVPHTVRAIADSWLVGITIPAGKGYPRAPERKRME